jgi:hypothetical protein
MTIIILTVVFLAASLCARKTRGVRIKDAPRSIEKLGIVKVGGKKLHIHHSYLGVLLLLGRIVEWSDNIAIALIVSDILFHLIAKGVWNDPLWD